MTLFPQLTMNWGYSMSNLDISQMFVSVVTALNDASNLKKRLHTIVEIEAFLHERYSDYEIVVVVQNRVQTAAEALAALLRQTPCIRYIQLAGNVTQDVLWSAGLENAIGDFLVLYDLDMDPVPLISEAVELCKSGHDVVIGTCCQKLSPFYALFRGMASLFLKLADYHLPKHATTFRCLSRRAANAVMATGHFHQQFFMRIQKTGYAFKVLAYKPAVERMKTFRDGSSSLINLLVFNSLVPLRLMTGASVAGSLLAFLFALYSLGIKLFKHDVVEGWTSTTLLISLLFMIQFVILAFISEYLVRLLEEQDGKASYSIVFEKNSLIMINQDRINVYEESTSDDANLVQTGRNK